MFNWNCTLLSFAHDHTHCSGLASCFSKSRCTRLHVGGETLLLFFKNLRILFFNVISALRQHFQNIHYLLCDKITFPQHRENDFRIGLVNMSLSLAHKHHHSTALLTVTINNIGVYHVCSVSCSLLCLMNLPVLRLQAV